MESHIVMFLFLLKPMKVSLLDPEYTDVDPDLPYPSPYPPLPFNPWELNYNAYYGDPGENATMSKMFLFPDDDEDDIETSKRNEPRPNREFIEADEEFPVIYDKLDPVIDHFEATEFKDIKEDLGKLFTSMPRSRRNFDSILSYHEDCPLCWTTYTDMNEEHRINSMQNLSMAFLYHARHRVRQAITIRNIVRNDKRYKLGYLFNRLRRLVYDQRKIFGSVNMLEGHYMHRQMSRNIHGYKMLLRLEVDIRDVIDLIKKIYYFEMDPKPYMTLNLTEFIPKKRKKKTGLGK